MYKLYSTTHGLFHKYACVHPNSKQYQMYIHYTLIVRHVHQCGIIPTNANGKIEEQAQFGPILFGRDGLHANFIVHRYRTAYRRSLIL